MKDEVFFLIYQVEQLIKIKALQRGQAVMVVAVDRSCGIEKFHDFP